MQTAGWTEKTVHAFVSSVLSVWEEEQQQQQPKSPLWQGTTSYRGVYTSISIAAFDPGEKGTEQRIKMSREGKELSLSLSLSLTYILFLELCSTLLLECRSLFMLINDYFEVMKLSRMRLAAECMLPSHELSLCVSISTREEWRDREMSSGKCGESQLAIVYRNFWKIRPDRHIPNSRANSCNGPWIDHAFCTRTYLSICPPKVNLNCMHGYVYVNASRYGVVF